MTNEVARDPLVRDGDQEIAPLAPPASPRRHVASWLTTTGILAFTGFVLLAVVGYTRFGSVGSALAYLRGKRLVPDAFTKSFGTVSKGEHPTLEFRLRNCVKQPLKILEANVSCTCLEARGLPMVIPPDGETVRRIDVRTRARSGPFSERLRLLTDSGEADFVLNIRGTVW